MNANAPQDLAEAATCCFFCGKKIADGQWFARLPHGERRVIFCRPQCVEAFLRQNENASASFSLTRMLEV